MLWAELMAGREVRSGGTSVAFQGGFLVDTSVVLMEGTLVACSVVFRGDMSVVFHLAEAPADTSAASLVEVREDTSGSLSLVEGL